eukprot:CAMPEP_0113719254 /NCGR_PEP_ID=MMETSP0038_2-20120614/35687_1 /TAXON_ID=2898 /ORGANISM="Cryptomonas paramecium" /LENGTH=100 /DNA_ID=CAMNT_0000647555 /DNA_START=978 /DNA_END=1280 /DNA_ORIENTATION=- /assembly_acc=CAM_ASM_000170
MSSEDFRAWEEAFNAPGGLKLGWYPATLERLGTVDVDKSLALLIRLGSAVGFSLATLERRDVAEDGLSIGAGFLFVGLVAPLMISVLKMRACCIASMAHF